MMNDARSPFVSIKFDSVTLSFFCTSSFRCWIDERNNMECNATVRSRTHFEPTYFPICLYSIIALIVSALNLCIM